MKSAALSRHARNDSARGHFELVEKIVCKHFDLQFRCKHNNVFEII
jgi:hypothetical protein